VQTTVFFSKLISRLKTEIEGKVTFLYLYHVMSCNNVL